MLLHRCASACALALFATPIWLPGAAGADHQDAARSDPGSKPGEEIVITGRAPSERGVSTIHGDHALPAAADTAALARLVPGADIVSNGPLSGQVQYRGLSGPRMNVSVDGRAPITGGPNWMDPPLHYAPRPLVERIEFDRGIAPVSRGPEGIGGAARAVLQTSRFTAGDAFEVQGSLDVAGRTPRGEFAGGGLLALANDRVRLHVSNATEFGTDWRSAEGTVRSTKYERYAGGIGGGLRFGRDGAHEAGMDYRHFRTQDAGSPALPMDVRFFDTEQLGGVWRSRLGDVEITGHLDWQDVDHGMDNFSQRADPASPMGFRKVIAHADRIAYGAGATVAVGGGFLRVGVDGSQSQHDANVRNPRMGAFFVHAFRNAERDRHSVFSEWTRDDLAGFELTAGLRYTNVTMDSGTVDALPAQAPGGPQVLRDAFNAADRSRSDDHFDYALSVGRALRPGLRVELGTSRKTRSASFFERYAWIPLEITGGLADLNNYVGTIDIDPEVSWDFDLGLEWREGPLRIAPRVFYRRVDDYIQGVPVLASDPNGGALIGVSTANGDATPLRFANVDAELWGVDAEFGLALPAALHLDATLSYVRARRRDIHDDLYRVAPLRGRLALGWLPPGGSLTAELRWAARQERVSKTNGETTTDGWAILNLVGTLEPRPGLELMAGVENVFDTLYRDHLAGLNRNAESATAVGFRLPGRGATAFARVRWSF